MEVAGQQRVNPETIRQGMLTQAGQPLDQDVVDLDMRRIYGSGDFESVRPELLDAGGTQTLVVNVTEKGWGPHYLRLGLSLSSDLGQDSMFNFYGQLRSTWLNSLGAEWRNDVVLGNDILLASRFYQPLSPSQRWFVEPRVAYSDTPLDIYDTATCCSPNTASARSARGWMPASTSATTVSCGWACSAAGASSTCAPGRCSCRRTSTSTWARCRARCASTSSTA